MWIGGSVTDATTAPPSVSDLKDEAVAALKAWIEAALEDGMSQAEIMGEMVRALS